MEEVTKYYYRQNEKIDVINRRLLSVAQDQEIPPLRGVGPLREWSLGGKTNRSPGAGFVSVHHCMQLKCFAHG